MALFLVVAIFTSIGLVAATVVFIVAVFIVLFCALFVGEIVYYAISDYFWRAYSRDSPDPEERPRDWTDILQSLYFRAGHPRRHRPAENIDAWRLVATLLRSSPDIYEAWHSVVLCDFDPIDDLLFPHASLAHFVEVQRWNSWWYTISIWEMSLLTGKMMRVCSFQLLAHPLNPHDTPVFGYSMDAFKSGGVIFIFLYRTLYVYDVRIKVKATFDTRPWNLEQLERPTAIFFLHRLIKNGVIDGWRIKIVKSSCCEYEALKAVSLSTTIVDLRNSDDKRLEVRPFEDIIVKPIFRGPFRLRSCNRRFGCIVTKYGKVVILDVDTMQFEIYDGEYSFRWSELEKYHVPLLMLYASIVTNREIVDWVWNRYVVRRLVGVPTLRMLACQSLFSAYSTTALKNMTATRFLKLTGVDLTGHFGQ